MKSIQTCRRVLGAFFTTLTAQTLRWVLVAVILIVLMAAPGTAVSQAVYSVAVDPVTPTTLFAGGDGGTLKSTDGGVTWSDTGLAARPTLSLAISRANPSTVYALTPAGVFKSADGGASWTVMGPTSVPTYSLAIDSGSPTTVYVATDSGVLRSADGGASWSAVGPAGVPIYSLAIDPVAPTTLYAGSAGTEGVRVFKSTDGGETWSLTGVTTAAWQTYSVFLVIDPLIPTTLYVAYSGWGCDGDGCFTIGAISQSVDGGGSWFEIDALLYRGSWVSPQAWPTALAVDPVTSTTLYAAWRVTCDQFDPVCQEESWIRKSTVDGAGSLHTPVTFTVNAFAIDPSTPTVLYVGTDSGVFKSTDGGGTWSAPGSQSPPPPAPPDTTPPDTSIVSALDGSGRPLADNAITLSTSVTFSFAGTDNVGVARFECQLDGAGFSGCTSPAVYQALALGGHVFEVRAVDTSNNTDGTAARYTWTTEVAPETTISGALDGRGKPLANGGTARSDTVTFSFTGTDNGTIAGFECLLDAGGFTACTSPFTYSGLKRGTHTFKVQAVDNHGFRDSSPAVFTWTR